MELGPARGMRDFPPEEKIFRDSILETFKTVFELYGFVPLETPVVERLDVLSAKYAGGAEIMKEMFTLTDQGERRLGLRYDMTVPLSRYVAMNPNLKMPFKRYVIGTVYRDGPIKLGRYREFYQCDCDIVGVDSADADAQCVQLALSVFKELGIKVKVYVNSVPLLKNLLLKEGVPEDRLTNAILILDKLKKIGEQGVNRELEKMGLPDLKNITEISQLPNNEERVLAINDRYGTMPELARLESLRMKLQAFYINNPEYNNRVVFDPSLSRGLTYYTGTVFEVFTQGIDSSLAAGGRYDKIVGEFIGRPDDFPAVGISFGLEPITEALKSGDRELRKTLTQVFVIPIGTVGESTKLTQTLRDKGINTDIDLAGRGISKNLEYANALGIPYVVLLGEKERSEGKYKLKDMRSGEESLLTKEELIERLK